MIRSFLEDWHSHFGPQRPDAIARAPGRVNIIGEHTDYNYGWVLPGAMSHHVYIMMSASPDDQHHWIAHDLNDEIYFLPEDDRNLPLWAKYVQGTLNLFQHRSPLQIWIGGDLPVGAGVSSSSSMTCGLLLALQKLKNIDTPKNDLAILARRVEREIIGLQGGIMDQYAIMLSQKDQVMLLDCLSHEFQFYRADLPDATWMLFNTKVKHQLIDSDYNRRATECMEAVDIIRQNHPDVRSLRDVDLAMIRASALPETLMKRACFVVMENQRVHLMISALLEQDTTATCSLLHASHKGLRDQYEVSCAELDYIADFLHNYPGISDGRMMGGGFGGCVIALVANDDIPDLVPRLKSSYTSQFGFDPDVLSFALSDGALLLS